MVAWAAVQAMKHNKPFTSLLEDEGLRMQPDDFDFGIAVALDNDALETAVIEHANKLSFKDFSQHTARQSELYVKVSRQQRYVYR